MITHPTVLVLGAGASVPYGFPCGRTLLQDIHRNLDPQSPDWIPILHDLGITNAEIEDFRWALYYSQQSSVDAFIEYRHEFLNIGKFVITLSILPKEDENWLLRFEGRDEGFYQYLFSKMSTSLENFGDNRLSVITFNYDRSIEHYLFKALQNTFNKPTECAKQLSMIPVIHVHGSLGKLPWQSSISRPYEASYGPEEIRDAASQIAIIHEGQGTSEEFYRAFNLLNTAERIYFLGFGFHSVNLERLRIDKLPFFIEYKRDNFFNPCFAGSSYGLEQAEISAIQNKWRIYLLDNNSNCLKFLRKYATLD